MAEKHKFPPDPIRVKNLSGGTSNGPPEGADPEEFWKRVRQLMTQGMPEFNSIRYARREFMGLIPPVPFSNYYTVPVEPEEEEDADAAS